MNALPLLLLTAVSGFAITLQGQLMGLMDRSMGTRTSVLITYGGGAVVASMLALFAGGINFQQRTEVPWYAYTAGLLGLLIVGATGYVVPRMGAAKGFTLIVAFQFLLALLIDHYGLLGATQRPLDLTRASGIVAMMAGVWLVVR